MSKKLSHAPLLEVIFELRWEIKPVSVPRRNYPTDEAYERTLAAFTKAVAPTLPLREQIRPDTGLPEDLILPYAAGYRFRQQQSSYPVLQLGPGVMTVNDTGGEYTWDTFRSLLEQATGWLVEAKGDGNSFGAASLRYLDGASTPGTTNDNFLDVVERDHLLSVRRDYPVPGALVNLAVVESRRLADGSILEMAIEKVEAQTSGEIGNPEPAILWTTRVAQAAATSRQAILDWVDSAHHVCSDLFRNSLSSEAYARFDR
jgi:uncharacterized protein (TIGR04255 family)